MKQSIAVRAFIKYKSKILIIREAKIYKGGANIGKYDLPGGKINPGEKYTQALLREIKEEAELTDIKIGKPFYIGEWRPKVRNERWQIIGIFFECFSSSDKVKLSEAHDKYLWISPKEYKKYNIIDNLIPAFEAYITK